MVKFRDFHDVLIETLQDPKRALAYLNEALEESKKGDEESQEILLEAMKNVIEAQSKVTKKKKKLSLPKEFYSKRTKPKYNTVINSIKHIGDSMGYNLTLTLSPKR